MFMILPISQHVETKGHSMKVAENSDMQLPFSRSFHAALSDTLAGEKFNSEMYTSLSDQLGAFLGIWFDRETDDRFILDSLKQELSALTVEDLGLHFEWEELMHDLIELEQELSLLDESSDHEMLLSLLQQIPVLTDSTLLPENADQGGRSVLQQMPVFLQKWAMLIKAMDKAEQIPQSLRLDPVQISELNSQLQKIVQQLQSDAQRIQSLQQTVARLMDESVTLPPHAVQLQKPEQTARFQAPTYLPQSWLSGTGTTDEATEHRPVLATATDHSVRHADVERPMFVMQEFTTKAKTDVPVQDKPVAQQPVVRMSQILEDLSQIFRAQLNKGSDEGTQLRVKLHPEHLGHLDIRITSIDGKITAQILAGTKIAKEALELTVGQLRTSLVQQGIQVEKIEIAQQAQQHQHSSMNDPRSQHQFSGQHSHGQSDQGGVAADEQFSYAAELQRLEEMIAEEHIEVLDEESNTSINLVV